MKGSTAIAVGVCVLSLPEYAATTDSPVDVPHVLLQAIHEQTGVPGLAAAVSIRGEPIWHGEAGYADVANGKPVTRNTVFRLASVSKAICSVMAAKLVEDGAIGLDDSAGDLLPELPAQYHELTLRDLMTHTSGLPHYELRDSARGQKNYTSATSGLEQLGNRKFVSTPGTSYLYSTHGFSLAGALMEEASGENFSEQFYATVGSVDGSSTLALESENRNPAQQTGVYDGQRYSEPRKIERENFSYSWCGAGMESSAIDLSNFASALFGPESPLGQSGLRLLTEPLPDRNGKKVVAERWEMTLGMRRSIDVRGQYYIHHAGVTNGARSILTVWPELGLAVSLLSNASWTGRMEDTAIALALAAEESEETGECTHSGVQRYLGHFRDSAIESVIEWEETAGYCRGHLRGNNALTDWLGRFNYASPTGHALVPLATEWWGLVSPIGISILSGDSTMLEGLIGSGQLTLTRVAL